MPFYETKPSHRQWWSHRPISKDSICDLCFIVLAWRKLINNEFTVGWSRCKQSVIAVEGDWSNRIRLVMISYCCLNTFLTNVYNSNTCIIAAESNERALWGKADICDWHSLRTDCHLLNYASIGHFSERYLTVIFTTGCQNHVIMRPGQRTDLKSRVWFVNNWNWYTFIYFMDKYFTWGRGYHVLLRCVLGGVTVLWRSWRRWFYLIIRTCRSKACQSGGNMSLMWTSSTALCHFKFEQLSISLI